MAQRVVIVQRRLTHYRLALFEALRDTLLAHDLSLDLWIGKGTEDEVAKQDSGELEWATKVPTRYFFGNRVCWQDIIGRTRTVGAALVVLPHENALLANHAVISLPRRFKLAFWGHGANFQSRSPCGFAARFKQWTLKRADWWFAYTDLSRKVVCATGFPAERVTVLNNAFDTKELYEQHASVTDSERAHLRGQLGFGDGPVGLFVGSLYPDKRIEFLLQAARAVNRTIPNFRLLIIGDGPRRQVVQDWCNQHSWARWVGARKGRDKAAYLSLGQLVLNPGLVGLSILDSFVCGLPLLTTDCGIHSPEIAYLKNWENGVITPNVFDAYVQAVLSVLSEPQKLDQLRRGCGRAASEYSLANMVARFANGIVSAAS